MKTIKRSIAYVFGFAAYLAASVFPGIQRTANRLDPPEIPDMPAAEQALDDARNALEDAREYAREAIEEVRYETEYHAVNISLLTTATDLHVGRVNELALVDAAAEKLAAQVSAILPEDD